MGLCCSKDRKTQDSDHDDLYQILERFHWRKRRKDKRTTTSSDSHHHHHHTYNTNNFQHPKSVLDAIDSIRWTRSILARPMYDNNYNNTIEGATNDQQQSHCCCCCCSHLFRTCPPPTLFGRYRYTGQWYLCRIRTYDCNDTFTICWEDGTMQIGTKPIELLRPIKSMEHLYNQNHHSNNTTENKKQQQEQQHQILQYKDDHSSTIVIDNDEVTVWEAAKRGDLETTLAIIDRGDATPNDVEILDQQTMNSSSTSTNTSAIAVAAAQGRTPLYWACFIGHVELVRELLVRGGIDYDGAAYLAVTSREKANDERDLLFNPDDNIFSDYVDYSNNNHNKNDTNVDDDRKYHISKKSSNTTTNVVTDDDTLLIRSMLLVAKKTSEQVIRRGGGIIGSRSNKYNAAADLKLQLPIRLYESTVNEISEPLIMNNNTKNQNQSTSLNHHRTCTNNKHHHDHPNNTDRGCGGGGADDDNEADEADDNDKNDTTTIINTNDDSTITTNIATTTTSTTTTTTNSNSGLCIVCLDAPCNAIPTPCGHIACCISCLTSIRNKRDGCPLCRSRIVAILSR